MGGIFKVGSRTVLLAVAWAGSATVSGPVRTARRGSSLGAAIAGTQVVMLAPSARDVGPEA